MKIFVVLYTIFCWLIVGNLSAQIYPNRNYSVKDGLLNSNVYSISQDSSGYMWFGTENGLSRFDGIEFVNYPLEKLGVNSYISAVTCVDNDWIYFGTGNDGIYSFDKKSGTAKKINKGNVSQSSEIIFVNDTIISLHEYHNLDFLSYKSGVSFQPDQMIASDPENKSFSILKHSDGSVFIGRKNGLYEIKNNIQEKIPGLDQPVFSIAERGNGAMMLGSTDAIYLYENGKFVHQPLTISQANYRIRNIIIDENENLWFNPWGNKDIYMVTKGNSVNVSEIAGIKSTSISRLFHDRDGNIWAGTIGKGVFLFSNMKVIIYPASDELPFADIKSIYPTAGGLILGTNDGLAFLDSVSGRTKYFKNLNVPEYVKGIVQISEDEFVVVITDANVDLKKVFSMPGGKFKFRYCQGSSVSKAGDTLVVGNWNNCYLSYSLTDYKLIKSECELFPGNFNKVRINSTLIDHNYTTWVGSQKGVLVKDLQGRKHNIQTFSKDENVISIDQRSPDKIALVTSSGFVVFENSVTISGIREIKRVHIPQTTEVCFIGEDEYIAGTLNGIIYHFEGKEKVLSIHQGIWSENVNCIFYHPGWRDIYIGSSEGLVKINLTGLRNSMDEKLKIHFLSVSHSGKTYSSDLLSLNFDYNTNPFTIITKSFLYQNSRSIKYEYRHNNSNWLNSSSGELYFATMEPGIHQIEVRASNDNRNWGPAAKVVIEIVPPFYKTIRFYILTIIIFLMMFYFIFRKIFQARRIKQIETLKTKQLMVELQQKALASNLNPHFVFNSLNSIQHFINKNNQEDANKYLVKFSQLMRMQLNMADMSFILLSEEINRLESYLSLEQMRFGNKLQWSIQVDPEIDRYSLKIPNMILQPFVENSIWHGIMPMKSQGLVQVNFRLISTGDLEIVIFDNGVGLGTLPKPVDSKHISKGVQLIYDRLTLLDPDNKDCINFTSANPGTIVTILLTSRIFRNQMNEIDNAN